MDPRRHVVLRRLLLLGLLAAVVSVSLATVWAQQPQNQQSSENKFGTLAAMGHKGKGSLDDCWVHHLPEGMTDSHVIVPIVPVKIDKGVARPVRLQVFSPWKNDVSAVNVTFNVLPDLAIGNKTHLYVDAGQQAEDPADSFLTEDRILRNPDVPANAPGQDYPTNDTIHFDVTPGAVFLSGTVTLYYDDAFGQSSAPPQVEARYFTPETETAGNTFEPSSNTARVRTFSLPTEIGGVRYEASPGPYRVEMRFLNSPGSTALNVTAVFNLTVDYEPIGEETEVNVYDKRRVPAQEGVPPEILIPKYQSWEVPTPVSLVGVQDGVQEIIIKVDATLWYAHKGEGRGTPDEDTFTRIAKVQVIVGDVYEESTVQGFGGATAKEPFFLVMGEVTGYVGGLLLLPSLFLGGTYGRASRKFFNNILHGAKRRVMYHNLLSLGLTLVAVVHIIAFVMEVRYSVLMGILWGGAATLSLLILALTGYYQVPLIQRHGFNWWRYVHLTFGLLVVAFVAYHAVLDGPDFSFIRDQLPKLIQDSSLVPK